MILLPYCFLSGHCCFTLCSGGGPTRRDLARQNKVTALRNATQLGKLVSAQRLLVIRAIDDEASLTMAFGAIVNYLISRSIGYILVLFLALFPALLVAEVSLQAFESYFSVAFLGCTILGFTLPLILMVSRTVHGRELAVSPMECQINTQSAPDAKGLSEIVTLVRHTYAKSLRHGIYDHEDCAKTISDWVRFRLETN
jgi:hypothetical protein